MCAEFKANMRVRPLKPNKCLAKSVPVEDESRDLGMATAPRGGIE